ncbi:MAG: hypothetical protein ACRDT6_10120 [Micromonosporaceae bacterium]
MVLTQLRERWGLVLVTVAGTVLLFPAATVSWLDVTVFVVPQDVKEHAYGLERFFPWGHGFVAGAAFLAVLVAVALVVPERFRLPAALVAVALAVLLALDPMVVAYLVEVVSRLSAEHAYALQRGMGDRYKVWTLVTSGGVPLGGLAVLLLGLAAAQLPYPRWGPHIQLGVATLITVPALALPWERVWYRGPERAEHADHWLPLISPEGAALTLGVILLFALTATAVLGRQPLRLPAAVTVVLLAVVLMVGIEVYDASDVVKARYAATWITVDTTMASALMELIPILYACAAVRGWWRGRHTPMPQVTSPLTGAAPAPGP